MASALSTLRRGHHCARASLRLQRRVLPLALLVLAGWLAAGTACRRAAPAGYYVSERKLKVELSPVKEQLSDRVEIVRQFSPPKAVERVKTERT